MLSDSESDDGDNESLHQLTINEHYAKAFEYRKEREELDKLKEKYGSDISTDASDLESETDSESAESEDEDGEELTPAVDAAVLRTLARIRKKDPAIYDIKNNIFGEEKEKVTAVVTKNKKNKVKSKPVTLRQVVIDAVLNPSRTPSPEPLPHVEEQQALRDETIAAFHTAVTNEDEDDLLVPREKTRDEMEMEEEEYRAFLQKEVGDLRDLVSIDGDENAVDEAEEEAPEAAKEKSANTEGNQAEKTKKKKRKNKNAAVDGQGERKTKTKAEQDQEFLMNYILNRGWIDRSTNHIPTYGEITSSRHNKSIKDAILLSEQPTTPDPNHEEENEAEGENDPALLSDSSFDSLVSHFESSYNHRFEEPGAPEIATFPRAIPSAVRRLDTTRKDARQRRKERKAAELEKKREEVRRLKALKMREVRRRLEGIGREGGIGAEADGALKELDLEGDWDPEKHDQQMAGLFGEEEVDAGLDEGIIVDEDGKPLWDDVIDIGDIYVSGSEAAKVEKIMKKDKKKRKKKKVEQEQEDVGVDVDAMDADIIHDDEEWDGTEEMRKRKLDEYMNEIYGLEFNDLVGDLPTRFKYVNIPSQSYDLNPTEILLATDQELNEYVGVKKYAPYRKNERKWDKKRVEKLKELKAKVNERTGHQLLDSGRAETGDKGKKKRIGKKERMKMKAAVVEGQSTAQAESESNEVNVGGKRKRENKVDDTVADEELGEMHASNGAKKKRKRRHKKKEGETEA